MLSCDECGAPLDRSGTPCRACGASRPPATTNGTSHPRLEGPSGLPDDEASRVQDEMPAPHHDEPTTGRPGPVEEPRPVGERAAMPAAPTAPRPAPFLRRVVALGIDLFLLSGLDVALLTLATAAVLLAEKITGARVGGAVDLVRSSVSAGSLTLLVGYFSVLHARSGQTLGKIVMRIQVRTEGGDRVGIVPSVLRTFAYALSALPFGAGFLLALLPAHRALHDYLAGTVVVRVEDDQ